MARDRHWGIARPVDDADDAVGEGSSNGCLVPVVPHLDFEVRTALSEYKGMTLFVTTYPVDELELDNSILS